MAVSGPHSSARAAAAWRRKAPSVGHRDGRAAAMLLEGHLGVGRQPVIDVLAEGRADLDRILLADKAEGDSWALALAGITVLKPSPV